MADKSIAEVLDNTVNQLSNGVQVLTDTIKKVAPNAWKIAVHQHQLLGGKDLVIGLLGLVIGLLLLFIAIKLSIKWKDVTFDASHPGYFLIIVAGIVAGTMFTCCGWCNMIEGYVQYVGAEYYAAKDILSIVK